MHYLTLYWRKKVIGWKRVPGLLQEHQTRSQKIAFEGSCSQGASSPIFQRGDDGTYLYFSCFTVFGILITKKGVVLLSLTYFVSVKDEDGFVHSIDNLVIEYVTAGGENRTKELLEQVQKVADNYKALGINYWERLNCTPCTKWSWAQHVVHVDDGIYLTIGHYVNYVKSIEKHWNVFPASKLEINPNKHADKPILKDLLVVLCSWGDDITLRKYDYAVDIPLSPDDVEVFGSRKEKGLYKGTRYFGQRNKNGYCKIYDKQKEQNLDNPLTRVEHTVVCSGRTTKNFSFENVYFKTGKKDEYVKKLTPTDKVLIDFCNLCEKNDLDYQDILQQLDKRKRRDIQEHLKNIGFEKLKFDNEIRLELLKKVNVYFGINRTVEILEDEEGFVLLDDSIHLPFE